MGRYFFLILILFSRTLTFASTTMLLGLEAISNVESAHPGEIKTTCIIDSDGVATLETKDHGKVIYRESRPIRYNDDHIWDMGALHHELKEAENDYAKYSNDSWYWMRSMYIDKVLWDVSKYIRMPDGSYALISENHDRQGREFSPAVYLLWLIDDNCPVK